ncbi:MAG: hypothetical protein ABJB66_02205 [Gemmatimonadaceae bacterium]
MTATPTGCPERVLTPSITLRPTSSLLVSLAPTFDLLNDKAQYIRTVPDANVVGEDPHKRVFATLHQSTLTISARVDWTLTPNLSAQLCEQPFGWSNRLCEYKELRVPRTLDFDVCGLNHGTATT